jgi:hypothetical protein
MKVICRVVFLFMATESLTLVSSLKIMLKASHQTYLSTQHLSYVKNIIMITCVYPTYPP